MLMILRLLMSGLTGCAFVVVDELIVGCIAATVTPKVKLVKNAARVVLKLGQSTTPTAVLFGFVWIVATKITVVAGNAASTIRSTT